MRLKAITGIMLALLLISMLSLAFDIQPARASGTIYIRADGSVEPEGTPISSIDNITYTFTDNIYDSIVVERNNIVLDGARHGIQGSGRGYGIYLYHRNNVTVQLVEITNFYCAIYLDHSNNNTISGNYVYWYNYYAIYLVYSNNNTIWGNNFSFGNFYAIYLTFSNNNTITRNLVEGNNFDGIWLRGSSNNVLSDNDVSWNGGSGIYLISSSNNVLSGNTASRNDLYGICVDFKSNNNTLSGNSVSQNEYYGIYLFYSSNNTLSGNSASTDNYYGIYLYHSSNNTLSGNSALNNLYNFGVFGSCFSDFNNYVDTSNTVDGKPIYYLIGVTDTVYDATTNAGTIYLIDCKNVTIVGYLRLNKNDCGVLFWNTTNSKIEKVTASNNQHGIHLLYSSGNVLFHNNIINNEVQALVTPGYVNTWDDGYPSGGNYWSDYSLKHPSVVDDYHGENQDILGGDRIWDDPYIVDVSNQDSYPFVNYWFLDTIPPVANAGPDQTVDEDTTVTFNGGASSDNVGIVGYTWTFLDITPQTLTGMTSNYTFTDPGVYLVTLNISDSAGNFAIDTVTITVLILSPELLIQRMNQTIATWDLPKGTENSLSIKLGEALHLLDIGNDNGAIYKLIDFVSQIEALQEKKLADEQANYLIAEAQRIMDLIHGPTP